MDEQYKKHSLTLSLANAVCERMLQHVSKEAYLSGEKFRHDATQRFCQAWEMLSSLPFHYNLRYGIDVLKT